LFSFSFLNKVTELPAYNFNFLMRILVTPMDWGLGHASRCVPLIRELIHQGAEVFLASSGAALDLLKQYFPQLPAENLPAYYIRYPSENMIWNMARQMPRISHTIWVEQRAVKQLVQRYHIECIISDNRFGCFTSQTRNIFITHQLSIQTPKLWKTIPVNGIVNQFNHHFIQRFDECWVPDIPGSENLSGALSAAQINIPVHFVGWFSSLKPQNQPNRYLCTAILSGPEPQRSRLEAILRPQLQALEKPTLLVRGKLDEASPVEKRGQLTIIPYLLGDALNAAITTSHLIIARSGYSTIMDLAILGQKALLIPTPGQTEQVYLARRLAARGHCWHQSQNEVDVAAAIHHLDEIQPLNAVHLPSLLKERIKELL
jgi:hypothetical protein